MGFRKTPHAQAQRKALKMLPTETQECITFFDWSKHVRYKNRPLSDRVVKIPNERGKAGPSIAYLQRMGMKNGFPDYIVLAPLEPYAGLLLEAKRSTGGKVSTDQSAWRDVLLDFGYYATICAGAVELIQATRKYMELAAPGDWFDPIGAIK